MITPFSRKRRLLAYFDAHPELVGKLSERNQERVKAMRSSDFSNVLIVMVIEPQTDAWYEWCRTWADPTEVQEPKPLPALASFRGVAQERERADLK